MKDTLSAASKESSNPDVRTDEASISRLEIFSLDETSVTRRGSRLEQAESALRFSLLPCAAFRLYLILSSCLGENGALVW
jgi:hypothetical protein